MSEFDEYFMRLVEEDRDDYDEDGRIRCRFCHEGNLEWDKHHHDATGRWRLWEGEWPEGQPHKCPAAFDFQPVKEEA